MGTSKAKPATSPLTSPSTSHDPVVLGVLGRPHGLKGDLRFFPEDPASELITTLASVQLGEGKEHALVAARPSGRFWIIALEGVRDRSAAEAITGKEIWVERELLPEAEEGEHYLGDLVGCSVLDAEGQALGTVIGVEVAGPQAFLTVESPVGRWLLPAVEAFLSEVDLEGGRLIVEIPEGLIESQQGDASGKK